ncbi:MAG TPA: DUF4350 domain-containing protein [Bacteroidia bacterium]|nr:DUF4350 domain-containing protein [Bacteroidia bacterium]
MKKNWPYYIVLLLVVLFLYRISQKAAQKQIDWTENYTGSSKSPFGCYVTKDFLSEMLTSKMEDVDRTVYENLNAESFSGQNYIFINADFTPSKQDVKQLCRFVSSGNTVFISARTFGDLSDTLKVSTGDPMMYYIGKDSIKTIGGAINSGSQFAQANLVNPNLHLAKNASFDHTTYSVIFTELDTDKTLVLGTDGNNYANYVRVNFGKGHFLLHTLPDAFGNYYAADRPTSKYLFRTLSYLPDYPTFFDEHYKIGRFENDDSRRYLLSEPALKLGYLVVIIAGLIALFFGGKRRQRPVPVVVPPANSTLEFVEQVGVLYYRQGNHADIVRKKINYFLESVRSRFFTQTTVFDDKFLERMESLSGVPKDQVRHLFATVDYLRTTQGCGESDLKNLEKQIWDFNHRSKR